VHACPQVKARTICMQFEGNWTPLVDIVVDKVGKYAYVIGPPHDVGGRLPIVMDVTLDVRTKVTGQKPLHTWLACLRPRSARGASCGNGAVDGLGCIVL
jgi:hypothetical protein